MKRIDHLANPSPYPYAIGSYLILQFGKGTQVVRIEGETKARYTIRRLQARNTENANWDYHTSQISKADPRILGELPADRLAVAQVIACPPLSEWVLKLEAAADRLTDRAAKYREEHGSDEDYALNWDWRVKSDEKYAAAHRKEAAMIAKLIPAAPAQAEPVVVVEQEAPAPAVVAPAQVEEPEDDLPAIEAPALPEVAPAVAARRAIDAAARPTTQQYGELSAAYDYFNTVLFEGALPRCLITMQRSAKMLGYFHAQRFSSLDGSQVTDEIALNPEHLRERTTEQSLSTLVHEMAHLWDHHFGAPARAGYHGKAWAAKMEELGLIPSSTGAPGGKKTGQKVSHYILEDGLFACRCRELIAAGWKMPYVQTPQVAKEAKAKKASKTKYTCPCCEANAWAKPAAKLICGECEELMVAPEEELEGELEEA